MKNLQLYEVEPAAEFADAHLIGNGRVGASIYGDIPDAGILLNEDTFWSGSELEKGNPKARENFLKARELVTAGKYGEAADLIESSMLGPWNQSYQPIGFLRASHVLSAPDVNDYVWRRHGLDWNDYSRSLDLEQAIARVGYYFRGNRYNHEYFVSHPSQLLISKIDCDSRSVNINLSFESETRHEVLVSNSELVICGRAPDHVEPIYSREKPSVFYSPDEESQSILCAAVVRVLQTDGQLIDDTRRICIRGASYVVWAVALRTNYAGYKQPRDTSVPLLVRRCEDDLQAATGSEYEALKQKHVADYKKLFDRVSLQISPKVVPDLPTGERIGLAGRHPGG